VYELCQSVDRERVTLLEGRCQGYGANTPYLPFLDALRRALGHADQDSPEARHSKTVEIVLFTDPALEMYLPHYLHLLSIPSARYPLPKDLKGEALRRELQDSLAAGLTLLSRRQPLLLILEDWHWRDEASESALHRLIDLIPRHCMLAIVLFRPEQYQPSWGQRECWTPIQLRPLEAGETARMIRDVLGTPELPEGLMPKVHERTGGNAFFNEEMALALMELGLIAVEGGRAKLSTSADGFELPHTVQATLRARVDRLDSAGREVLRLASVIGGDFDRAVLEKIADSSVEVDPALERLARQELVVPVRLVPTAGYMFKHVLTRDVVYEELALGRRKALHEQVGAAIEALFPDRLEEHYEALAGHYGKSDNAQKAIEYLEKAGDRASGHFSLTDARRFYYAAIKLLEQTENIAQGGRKMPYLAAKLGNVSYFAPTEELQEIMSRATKYAREFQDDRALGLSTYWSARLDFALGRIRFAESGFKSSIEIGRALGDESIHAVPTSILGRMRLWQLDYKSGVHDLESALPALARAGEFAEHMIAQGYLAHFHAGQGNFDKAEACSAEASERSVAAHNTSAQTIILNVLAIAKIIQGDWTRAFDYSSQVVQISRSSANPLMETLAVGMQGFARFMLDGDLAGLKTIPIALAEAERMNSRLFHSLSYGMLAEMQGRLGRYQDAIQSAQRSLDRKEDGNRSGEVIAEIAMALAKALHDEPPTPHWKTHIENAKALAREKGLIPYLGMAHLRAAELMHMTGETQSAADEVSKACALFRDMKMPWWTEQAAGLRARIEGGQPFVWFPPYVGGPPKLDG
jgi:tetratricopeptide (TPR) repeat protein